MEKVTARGKAKRDTVDRTFNFIKGKLYSIVQVQDNNILYSIEGKFKTANGDVIDVSEVIVSGEFLLDIMEYIEETSETGETIEFKPELRSIIDALQEKTKKKEYKTIPKFGLTRKPSDIEQTKITCSDDIDKLARQFYHDDMVIYESLFLVLLDYGNNVIGYVKISQGGICGTVVDIRIIAKYCIEAVAPKCVIVHNHPSGNTKFSNEDLKMSRKLKEGLKLLDVDLLDSLVITALTYTSMADEENL